MLADYALTEETQKEHFISSIANSPDIVELVTESAIVHYADSIGGSPKLLLTVLGKIIEAKSV
jgi:hypothetical protein